MKNTNVKDDMFTSIYDLKGKYRYRYMILDYPNLVPAVVMLCEGEQYEISIRQTFTVNDDGHIVVNIKHPEFHIVDCRLWEYGDQDETGLLVIKASDMNVEKKIATFTKSLIIAENIMNLIDMFFLGSDKSIYR